MDFKYKQLEQELSALSKVFSELGVRLSEVAKEVTAPGVNPSEKLIEQISATRASFESVRSAVHGHATAMLVSPLPKLGELVSIATIDSLSKASAVAEENKFSIEAEREKALAILGRALSIIHRETADFKPLQECHAKIGELRNAVLNVVWPHRHPESESIAGLKHPATDFMHFVENLDRIDDERWMALETTITESYGKPLFVAASRGKLAQVAESKPDSQAAATKPAAAPPEPAKPGVAAEKPVEKKIVAEKVPEKPPPAPVAAVPTVAPVAPPAVSVEKKPAPVPVAAPAAPAPAVPAAADKAPQKPPAPPAATPSNSAPAVSIQTTPVLAPEKKPVQAVPAPAQAASTPVAPHAAVPATPAPAAATASVPPAPAAAPVALPRPPAPAPPAAAVAATPAPPVYAPATPAAAASIATTAASPLAVTINSLSALATATEPVEKKPMSAPTDTLDKQRKEPRLAAPAPQSVSRPEPKGQEVSESLQAEAIQQGMGVDGSQRPQRWGFWRGNR